MTSQAYDIRLDPPDAARLDKLVARPRAFENCHSGFLDRIGRLVVMDERVIRGQPRSLSFRNPHGEASLCILRGLPSDAIVALLLKSIKLEQQRCRTNGNVEVVMGLVRYFSTPRFANG